MKLRVHRFLFVLLMFLSASVFASTSISISIPRAPEIIAPPPSHTQCHFVPAGNHRGEWHDQHRVCQFVGPHQRGFWISAHWMCPKFSHKGRRCKRWVWVPTHIEKRHNVVHVSPVMPQPQPIPVYHAPQAQAPRAQVIPAPVYQQAPSGGIQVPVSQ